MIVRLTFSMSFNTIFLLVSASISRTCPNGTNCVIASSCPTIIRLIKQNKQNVVNTMWCGREESRIKVR